MTRNGFRNFFVAPRTWRARLGVILGGLCVLAACGVIRYCWGTSAAKAQVSAESAPANSVPVTAVPAVQFRRGAGRPKPSRRSIPGRMQIPDVVASVNGHAITPR